VDLVVTDLITPEMGGQELVQRLRRQDPSVKALAITGYAMRAGAEQLREMGFSGVVRNHLMSRNMHERSAERLTGVDRSKHGGELF
jgi:CheY-like chemotaxis protein